MTILLQIRDVDKRVRDELKARAALEGKSLNAYLKSLLEDAVASPRRSEVLERILARSESSATSSVDDIRRDRDARAAGLHG